MFLHLSRVCTRGEPQRPHLQEINSHPIRVALEIQHSWKLHTGKHVGEELDLVATYDVNPNFSVQFGYLWFWYGAFVQNNSPRGNAEQLYLMTTFRY